MFKEPKDIQVEFLPLMDNRVEERKAIAISVGGDGFEFYGHKSIGDKGFKLFFDKISALDQQDLFRHYINRKTIVVRREHVLKLALPYSGQEPLLLSPGEIVGLAGDFFGLPGKPISFATNGGEGDIEASREARFIDAYTSLITPEHHAQIQEILAYSKEQEKLVRQEVNPQPEEVVLKRPDGTKSSTIKYSWMTRKSTLPGDSCHNRYLELAANNFDHFGEDAAVAFETGLRLGIARAETARTMKNEVRIDEVRITELLTEAVGYVLFACHFLTDLYAAGHIDTPRRALLNAVAKLPLDSVPDLGAISFTKRARAGLFAKAMHDEDCKLGLYVHQPNSGTKWQAFGDGKDLSEENKPNAEKAAEAVSLALEDIYLTYMSNPTNQPLFVDTFRDALPKRDDEGNKNHLPLFRTIETEEGKKMEVRQPDNTYQPFETGWFSMFRVKVKQEGVDDKGLLSNEEMEQLAEEIEQLEPGVELPESKETYRRMCVMQ